MAGRAGACYMDVGLSTSNLVPFEWGNMLAAGVIFQ